MKITDPFDEFGCYTNYTLNEQRGRKDNTDYRNDCKCVFGGSSQSC